MSSQNCSPVIWLVGYTVRKSSKALQEENNFTELMILSEQMKTMPLGDIWSEYLRREGVPEDLYTPVKEYETEILKERK